MLVSYDTTHSPSISTLTVSFINWLTIARAKNVVVPNLPDAADP